MQLCDYSLNSWIVDRNSNKEYINLIKTDENIHQQFISNGLNIFKQILDGIDYIHTIGVIHRDLKPSNIFLCNTSEDIKKYDKKYIVKIGDFGLATKKLIINKHSNGIGTIMYSSPEQIHSNYYDHRTDIYSLGLILFELLYPMKTSMEKIELFEKLKNEKFPTEANSFIKDNLKDTLMKMLSKDPEYRASISDIQQCI